ncbi:shikimate kinase [Crocinitomix algicola]|uniref:shikimate kinase n=1 Tax=Crocinitomix algicola TaxID=1740263 RepID=UPI00087321CB|nr:shikimate kinase [Crocinitomix algicola]
MANNIFLYGFMGAGKSTFGKKLARKLGWIFIDSDKEIEKQTQKTIAEIFEENGENYFRQLETEWLNNFSGKSTVVALGGGTPCFNNNQLIIKEMGVSIYLEMSSKILTNRLMNAKNTRPLISAFKANERELNSFIQEKLEERKPCYSNADITFSAASINAERMEELIVEIKRLF